MKNTAGTSAGGYRACARGTSDAVLSEQSYDDFIAECASPVAFAIVEVEQIERAAGPFRTISSCGPSTRTSPLPPIIRVGRGGFVPGRNTAGEYRVVRFFVKEKGNWRIAGAALVPANSPWHCGSFPSPEHLLGA